jgi:hypothetical protein
VRALATVLTDPEQTRVLLALATGNTDQAPVTALLTHLLDTLPRDPKDQI